MKINKKILILLIILLIFLSGFLLFFIKDSKNLEYISYKDFYESLNDLEISKVIIEDNKIVFEKNNNEKIYYTDNPNSNELKEKLLLLGVNVETNSANDTFTIIFDIIFYAIFFCMIGIISIKFSGIADKTFKIVKHTEVKFDDIAGMENLKKEMMQVVEVLKFPTKYKEKGIRQIKGIIFEGPPGNGKTMFAKALAEEAKVNFIATKGADFQSAMMSMGARKIKLLFKKARRHKPCIVFIDEFDGIGERRNYAGTGVDKENNRIITAMLNEMDGFDTKDGILVIAATNSYSSLDPALIRPGRFDLKYNISNPDLETRYKLIQLYTSNKKLSKEIDIDKLAKSMENLSCAAIESLLNEASMFALLKNKEEITKDDILNASKKMGIK